MKSLFLILSFLFILPVCAEPSHNEIIEKFLNQRKKMMESLMKAFDDDDFFKEDFFSDKDLFDSFKFKGFQGQGDNVKIEEVMEKDGTISLFITPLNKDTNLDINTDAQSITIKSSTKKEEGNSMSQSSFSKMISIPEGYTATPPTKDGDRIKIGLVPSKKNPLKPNKDGRIPIPKMKGEKTI